MAGTFTVLDPHTVAYLDITGSGIETVAHLRDNGRIVIMFCAFAGPPRIVRLHGRGTVVLPGDGEWEELAARFPPQPGTRSVIKVAVDRVSDSCGFGVPFMTYEEDRGQLADWAVPQDRGGAGRATGPKKNATSIDGLPGRRQRNRSLRPGSSREVPVRWRPARTWHLRATFAPGPTSPWDGPGRSHRP